MMKKTATQIKLFCFLFAFCSCIYCNLISIYYLERGFNELQIGFICSIATLGAFLQPIIGVLVDSKFGINKVISAGIIILSLCFIFLFVLGDYILVCIITIIYSVVQIPISSLIENTIVSFCRLEKLNYGKSRRFMSLAWGTSLIIVAPFLFIFGVSFFLIILFGTMVLIFYIFRHYIVVKNIQPVAKKKSYLKIMKFYLQRKEVLLYIMFATLFMSSWGLKSTYQSILVYSHTTNYYAITIIGALGIILEIILFPKYEHIISKISIKNVLMISVICASSLCLIYALSEKLVFVLLASILHGVVTVLYVPTSIFMYKYFFSEKYYTSGLLLASTIQNIFCFLLSLVIITPIYYFFGVQTIYLVLVTFMLISLIPLQFIDFKKIKSA